MIAGGTDILREDALNKMKQAAQFKCVSGVLKTLLDREPTYDDYSKVSVIPSTLGNDHGILTYKGHEIGIIKCIDEPERYRVEFQPLQKAN
jgi:hypothetical protein